MCIIVSVKKSTKVASKSKTPVSKAKTTKVTKSPKITEKAGNVVVKPKRGSTSLDITPNPNSFYNLITGELPDISTRPQDLIKLNTGYVSVCLNKNAQTISNIPIKLYFNQSSSSIKSTAHKSVSELDFEYLKRTVNTPIVKALETSSDVIEIVEHPILDLLSKVNPTMSYIDLVMMTQKYLGILGNAYVRIEFDKETGLPSALYPLLAEYVTPIATGSKTGRITDYKYTAGKKPKTFKAKEIIHFINVTPGSTLLGVGELEQVLSPVNRYNYYNSFETYINANYGRADFIIAYNNKMSKKDLDESFRQWKKRLGGANKGNPIVSAGNFEIKNTGLPPKDMSWIKGRENCILEISNIFGIPESLLKLNSSNLASANTSTFQYYTFTCFPKLAQYLSTLNDKLLTAYSQQGMFLWYDSRIPTDRVSNSAMVVEQLAAGIISREEARSQLGYTQEMQDTQEGSG